MLNRFLAWDQLGEDVSSANSSEEALELAGLNWDVTSNFIYNSDGDIIEGYRANTRQTDNSVLGIVGERYSIVQNRDAFNFTDELLGTAGVKYEKAGVFHFGRAVWLLAKMPRQRLLNDDIDPYMVFINSHDGCGSVKVALIPNRIVCSNALNINLKNAQRVWTAIHSHNIMLRLDDAKRSLGLADAYLSELDIEAYKLANEKFSDSEFEKIIDSIYPITPEDSARKIENINNIKNSLFACLDAPDVSTYRDSKYGKYLAITDYYDHADPSRITPTFKETRWENISTGHNMVDAFYKELKAA